MTNEAVHPCRHGNEAVLCIPCHREEIERLQVRINGYADANVELRAEIEQLRTALRKCGRHPTGDMEGVGRCAGFKLAAPFRDDLCDCGLNAALAGQGK